MTIRRMAFGLAAAAAVIAAMFGAQAFGRSVAATVGAATNPSIDARLAVDQQGRTLYSLSPETAHHLLCVSRRCLAAWPPATVSSAHAKLTLGSGIAGRLAILRRSDGRLQLTLRGLPLYRYGADHAKGQANGDGIRSFGGTWHVVSATGTAPSPTATTTPAVPTSTAPAPVAPAPVAPTPVAPVPLAPAPPAGPATTPTTPTTTTPSYPVGYTY
jgi:predicted lipoprotein with Yx(FWY)xxD motif